MYIRVMVKIRGGYGREAGGGSARNRFVFYNAEASLVPVRIVCGAAKNWVARIV